MLAENADVAQGYRSAWLVASGVDLYFKVGGMMRLL